MKRTGVLVAAALMLSMPAGVAAQEAASIPQYELTREVRRAVEQARVAVSQNNFQAASAALAEAQGQAQTDGDRYVITVMQLDVANRTFNANAQMAAVNTLIASPLVSEAERAELYFHRGRLAYQAQDFEGARQALQTAVTSGSTNPRAYVALADIEAERGNHARALELFDRAVALRGADDGAVSEAWLRRAIDLAQRVGNLPRATQLTQTLLASYPTERNWRDALAFYRKVGGPDPQSALDSWRLQAAAGALAGEADYLAYAELANQLERPGEVQRVIQAGRDAAMLDGENDVLVSLMRGAERAAPAARDRLEAQTTAARSAATGAEAMTAADAQLAFGNYAEAAALYRTAIEKGGIDAELANLRLGEALALAGDAAGARTALAAVTGPRSAMAGFWRVYADNAPAPPAVAQAASPETAN